MNNRQNPYPKQIIQISEESKKQIVISSDLILSSIDDCSLGKMVRKLLKAKIEECDETIERMKNIDL